MQKVPLHLSYRIFETASKRLKLSEDTDNANYKKALMETGINSMELNDGTNEKSSKREWKEVQLKISETGVMSVTDISSTTHKRVTEIENLPNEKTSKGETVTSIAEINKADVTKIGNCGISKSSVEMPSTLIIDAEMTKNPIFSDSSNTFLVTSDVNFTSDNLSTNSNCVSLTNQQNGTTTKQTNEMRNCTASAKLQQETQEVKVHNQNVNVEDKSEIVLQGRKNIGRSATQFTEENVIEDKEKMDAHAKKISINNNNADFQAETRKECVKSSNETKIGSAGSKIDALSAKLQFQPKMGQVNNTYSKRAPKEKRVTFQQSTKKSNIKSSTEDAKLTDTKAQTNCGNVTNKVLVSTAVSTPSQKSTVSTVASQSMSDSSGSDKQKEKDNQSISIDLQQALNLLEQKNSPVQTSITESVPKTSHVANTVNQKLQNNNTTATNDNIASTAPNVSTSTISQTTSTFPYALHDIVTNSAVLKSALKNSSSSVPQKPLGTSPVVCSTSNNQMSPMPQFNMQTSSTNVYPIPTSLKNKYGNVSQDGGTVMTTSIATVTTTAISKPMPTSACPIPPCPDAIPISLMKQMSMRKQDVTAKGTNLNEICAKIGSNTIGSKINDICAKIGENSKEKNRMDTHKSDVPDLLRINAKKNPLPLVSNSDTTVKHIPNIPNIPVYTPSSNVTTVENKSAKPALLTSTSAGALAVSTSSALVSHITGASQRLAPLKKQSQSVGYKTLRDPPKSWNPTLSKNNYVAAKNQAKEMQNQTQTSMSEGTNKQIPFKSAKIFKRNMPRYLGNPASGVKPMYGVTTDTKEKEQSTNAKSATLNMMKIEKTLSSIVSTINSPIVSPPPYSPNARSYQNTPFSRDICRNTGSPISPRNSPVNMLSTNPFIPSPTLNTNPRLIYFPPPFSDANRFPNPLIRSPIGIPPSAFHSSLPPSINKLYQRSSYIPQTCYASVVGQPPTVQRIPPSTHSTSPKSPRVSSPSSISSTSFNLGKAESQSPITSTVDSVALLLSKSVTVPVSVPVPVSVSLQRELDAFNLSKTGGLSPSPTSNVVKTSPTNDVKVESQLAKSNSSMPLNLPAITTSVETSKNSSAPNSVNERKHDKETEVRKTQEATRCKEDNSKAKLAETKCIETADNAASLHDKREKNQAAKINGDVTTEQFTSKKSKEGGSNETAIAETTERDGQIEQSSSKEQNSISKNNTQVNISDSKPPDDSKNEDLGKSGEQIQGNKSEVQKNKAET